MRALLASLAISLTACGAGFGVVNPDGPGGGADAGNPQCPVTLDFSPNPAHAGSGELERATATVHANGVFTYSWFVTYDGADQVTANPIGDGGAIDFPIENVGTYEVSVGVTSDIEGSLCTADQVLNVLAHDPNQVTYRARVTPPPSTGAPPYEQQVHVSGGGNQAINLSYPQVSELSATVSFNGTPTLAYIQVAPPNTSTFVDTFTDGSGHFGPLTVLGGSQDVLIVPSVPGPAPQLVHWDPTQSTFFTLAQGTPITGHVGLGAGNLGGAQVQLLLGGKLPLTLTTTASDGSFTVFADMTAADLLDDVTVTVTPPVTSGLARLTTRGAIALGAPLNISYTTVTKRDLAGIPVTIGGAPAANAKVIVASASGAGTIAGVSATGALRVSGATGAGGTVTGSLVAPATNVSVVVQTANGLASIVAVDLTAGVPASIVAPAPVAHGGTVADINSNTIPHAVVELVPAGDLAIAGVPAITTLTDTAGAYSVQLAPSATYDFRVFDLAGKGPLHFEPALSPNQIGNVTLSGGLRVDGIVQLPDLSPAAGASVLFLCFGCTGPDADRPVAESATDFTGTYHVGIADPGTGG